MPVDADWRQPILTGLVPGAFGDCLWIEGDDSPTNGDLSFSGYHVTGPWILSGRYP